MIFEIITLFPEFFDSPARHGVIGRAISSGKLECRAHNLRDFTTDKHRTTDDYPYGGGHGMVMKVEPVARAIDALKADGREATVVLTSPQGTRLDQGVAAQIASAGRVIIVCGRYEGYDERIRPLADMEVSIGDYVISGGEAAALVIMDAAGRLIPGVLGEPESAKGDSFSAGLLEYPQYTRPEEYMGIRVPDVLLSGNHAEIDAWRRREGLRRTYLRRPDLLEGAGLTQEDLRFLAALGYRKSREG